MEFLDGVGLVAETFNVTNMKLSTENVVPGLSKADVVLGHRLDRWAARSKTARYLAPS